ncbi:MAG TPA: phage tail assembly chaperone [Novosphingobium sp.]|nr:phage tail assembly chaperone [Novosphingobium sp.]HMP57232.1 phage tail assembly chaperone [Novosphingobium sp.]
MNERRFADAAMHLWPLAAQALGWKPADFWAATPVELASALCPPGGGEGLSRHDLTRMMEQDHADDWR